MKIYLFEGKANMCGENVKKYRVALKLLKNVTLNAKGSESLPTHYFFTQKQRKRPYTATL